MSEFFAILIVSIFTLTGCTRSAELQNSKGEIRTPKTLDAISDSVKIQELVRQALDWSDSDSTIVVDPVFETGGVYLFDKNELQRNLDKLRLTGLFANEFIENYKQIILTLDQKLRNKEFDPWLVGDLPPFKFANDAEPWCMCQGLSLEQYDGVEIIRVEKESAEGVLRWKEGSSWIGFKFRARREAGEWRISYMQGFDYAESIKKDGEN